MTNTEKRGAFATPDGAYRPMYYFDLPLPHSPDMKECIATAINTCFTSGCATIIPRLPDAADLRDDTDVEAVRDMYRELLSMAAEKGLKVGFSLDFAYERYVIDTLAAVGDKSIQARQLECKEYICRAEESLSRTLHEGELLSLVAYSEAYGEVMDLRPFVRDGKLITGTSAGCAIAFGLALVDALKGQQVADTIAQQIVIR